jgi:FtsZ-binding cell division protein ZapB
MGASVCLIDFSPYEGQMARVIILRNLSCSGGTYLTSVLTARRDISVLNEFHPCESTPGHFSPNSLIGNLVNSGTTVEPKVLFSYRTREINTLKHKQGLNLGDYLFIRWHSYFDYFTGFNLNENRVQLFGEFCEKTECKVFTVLRDPLTSYVSNVVEGFLNISFGEYLIKYEQFVAESDHAELYRYEDICLSASALEEISTRFLGYWNPEQLDSKNWKPLSGTRHLKTSNEKPNLVSLNDARKILHKFTFSEIEHSMDDLEALNLKTGYDVKRSNNQSYVDLAVSRLNSPLDALTQERDALTQERDALTQERDALTQERDALTQERDALTQERDALISSISWKITRPFRRIRSIVLSWEH